MKKIFFFLACLFFFGKTFCQLNAVEVYPSNWWIGMKMNRIQLMIRIGDKDKIIPKDKLVFNCSPVQI